MDLCKASAALNEFVHGRINHEELHLDPVGIFDGMDRSLLLLLCDCLSVRSLNSTLSLCIFTVACHYVLRPSPDNAFLVHMKSSIAQRIMALMHH